MRKANVEIREAMKSAKVPVWAIAEELGAHENTVLRRMRTELPEQTKQQYLEIIRHITPNDQA